MCILASVVGLSSGSRDGEALGDDAAADELNADTDADADDDAGADADADASSFLLARIRSALSHDISCFLF